jgi:hypothetical protein
MKRAAYLATAFLCATAISAMAQTPTTTTATGSTTDDKGDKITLSGCLQGGSQSSTTAASTSTASSGIGSFVLMTSPQPSSTTTAGTTGTTGSDSTARAESPYVLEGHDSELRNHVGHRIEVTGTVENTAAPAPAPNPTSTTTSGSASDRMSTATPTLKVSSIRMIAADCAPK